MAVAGVCVESRHAVKVANSSCENLFMRCVILQETLTQRGEKLKERNLTIIRVQ